MKFYLAIFAAVLCASAVTGAPSTEDEGRWYNFKCVGDILKEDASPQVKELWAEYAKKLKELHDSEWVKCKAIEDVAEQHKCKGVVILKSIPMYSEFFKKFVKIADWEKVKEIYKKAGEKCVNGDFEGDMSVFEGGFMLERPFDLFSLIETVAFGDKHSDYWLNLKCAWGVIAEKSSPEIKELWGEYKKKMKDLKENNWAECKKIENIADQQKCMVGVMEMGIDIFSEFLSKFIKAANYDVALEILKDIRAKCVKHDSVDSEDIVKAFGSADVLVAGVAEKIKCVKDAIADAVKGTDFSTPWEKLKKDLEGLGDRLKACKGDNLMETAMCVADEVTKATDNIKSFLDTLKTLKKDAYERAMNTIKEKCQ